MRRLADSGGGDGGLRRALRLFVVAASALLVGWVVTTADLGAHSPLLETLGSPSAEAGERRAVDLSRLRLLTRCVGFIRTNYVVPQRVKPAALLIGALRGAENAVPDLMVTPDSDEAAKVKSVEVRIGDHRRTFDVGGVSDLYEMNWRLLDVFEFVAAHLPADVKSDDVEYAAINGMLTPLDEHSVYLTPEAFQEMQLDTQGRFGGLGIVISTRKGLITLVSVMPDTPASKAALKSGDQFLQIGDESAINMALTDAVSKLRGEPGTKVTVLVQRKEWTEPHPITMERAEIHVRSVTSESLGDGIGYARIRNFQEDTAQQVLKHLSDLKTRGSLKGLVLDLRQNPGGLLEQSVEVSNLFIRSGSLVITEGEGKRMRQEYEADGRAPFADLPMVVLVDGGSASAAEIVAGALKNDDRAPLIGTTTFGKGTVQVMYEVGDGALKLTVAQYLTPGDISIQGVGVVPDVELIPATASAETVALGSGDDRREHDLKRLLEAFGKVAHDLPARRIRHMPADESDAAGNDDDPEDAPLRDEETFKRDDSIELAQAMVKAMGTPTRAKGLAAVSTELDNWARIQDTRIVERLAVRGIDWTDGPRQAGTPLRVTWSADGSRPLTPGAKVTLRMTVKNPGTDTQYRARVVTESDFGTLDGREFVFGRLEPGASLTRDVVVKVPTEAWDRLDRVSFHLFLGENEGPAPEPVMVTTKALPRPRFAWGVQVLDTNGNGDGILNPGETATLLVDLRNDGEGAARKLLVTLRNKSGQDGVFVREGRFTLADGLQPGKSAQARFKIELKHAPTGALPTLEVGILDLSLREFLSEDTAIPVAATPGPALEPRPEALRVLRDGVAVRSAATKDASELFFVPAGFNLRSDGRVGDWWRVEIEDGRFAFVRSADAEPVAGAVRFSTLPLSPLTPNVVPALDLRVEELPAADGKAARLRLTGTARFVGHAGEARRKVLIFRGNDKVYFWTRKGPTNEAAVDLDTTVPLVDGRNDVAVFAIEGKDRTAVRRFTRFWAAPVVATPVQPAAARGGGR
jgi:carboxyl-terminal processing protease